MYSILIEIVGTFVAELTQPRVPKFFWLFFSSFSCRRRRESSAVWPYWTIFQSSSSQFFFNSSPIILAGLFGLSQTSIIIKQKTTTDTFGQRFENFGLSFIPTSGHTGHRRPKAVRRWRWRRWREKCEFVSATSMSEWNREREREIGCSWLWDSRSEMEVFTHVWVGIGT